MMPQLMCPGTDVVERSANSMFSDVKAALRASTPITKLIVYSGDVVDAIQAFNGSTEMPRHGGSGGGQDVVELSSGEYITGIFGFIGYYFGVEHIAQLTIVTNNNVYGPFGTTRYVNNPTRYSVNADQPVIAFFGSSFRHSDNSEFLSSIGIAAKGN